jgi:hypothetical protein
MLCRDDRNIMTAPYILFSQVLKIQGKTAYMGVVIGSLHEYFHSEIPVEIWTRISYHDVQIDIPGLKYLNG